ncbi:MAG: Crp/Fnr family transcriptional regulator [Alphaproteobacteria bacterium]|nr:Crp/Fnr family transcriptional regulator [Alphaproteobacteria bacterium]
MPDKELNGWEGDMPSEALAMAARQRPQFNYRLSGLPYRSIEETIAVLDAKATTRSVRAGLEIVSEGRRCAQFFVVVEGIGMRYRVLRDGQRQVLNLVLPGDLPGIPSCFFETALYSIRSLTPMVLLPVSVARLIALFETHPRAAAKLLCGFAAESAVNAERLITLGRRSATERIAHFLLELFTRLQTLGLTQDHSFRVPLTQEMLSDALGLSIPYVNRVLHKLREEGLVRIKDQVVFIDNPEELEALADFEDDYLTPLSIAELAAEIA